MRDVALLLVCGILTLVSVGLLIKSMQCWFAPEKITSEAKRIVLVFSGVLVPGVVLVVLVPTFFGVSALDLHSRIDDISPGLVHDLFGMVGYAWMGLLAVTMLVVAPLGFRFDAHRAAA